MRIFSGCLLSAMVSAVIGCGPASQTSAGTQTYAFTLLDSSPSGSPFSRLHFKAQGIFQVSSDCSLFASYPNYAGAGLSFNGQYSGTLNCTSTQPQVFSVTPESGAIVDIVSGPRIRLTPASSVTGDTVESFSGNALTAMEAVKPLVVVYGDSIASGFGTDVPTRDAWTILLRSRFEVGVEAWGARQLTSDYASGLDNLIGYLSAYGTPSVLWIAIGVNDFFASVPPAQFQIEYAALLDADHSAFPNAKIYAQTPLILASEAPNVSGDTLAKFRSAISAVCATRTFCNLVDGAAILTPSDLNPADGVHPTTEGNAKYYAFVLRVLQ